MDANMIKEARVNILENFIILFFSFARCFYYSWEKFISVRWGPQ